ncbi:MAG: transglutaminase-like domain-containing protein [Desulfobacteraceae bacterium]
MTSEKTEDLQIYLHPTYFIDCDSPQIIDFANRITRGVQSNMDKAIKLYYAVRDGIFYDPYGIDTNPESMKASFVLNKGSGFCVAKAILLAAVTRAENIPSRLGFADVRNHLTSERLRQFMQTDVFVFHGYTELLLENKWVKATPAFNLSLCEKSGIHPLAFDGKNDSIFHPYDKEGRQHMEYVRDRGKFPDFPRNDMLEAWEKHYPRFNSGSFDSSGDSSGGNFEEDVAAERKK